MIRPLLLLVTLLVLLPTSRAAAAGGPDAAGAPSVVELFADAAVLIEAPENGGFRVLITFPDLGRLAGKTVVRNLTT